MLGEMQPESGTGFVSEQLLQVAAKAVGIVFGNLYA
jgi:hypothetical protein